MAYTLVAQNNTLVQGNFGPPSPSQIAGAAYVPSLNEVFIGDTARVTVFGINGSTGLLENTIKVAWDPQGLAFDSRDNALLVATGAAVAVVNLTSFSVLGWVNGTGGTALLYDPQNGLAYVADFNNAVVRAINVTSRHIIANISVGAAPDALALDPADHLLYVANYVYFSVSIINTSSNQILVNQVKLGTGQPYCLAYDPRNGFMYVGNQISGNVSVLVASNHTFVGRGVNVSGDCLSMVFDPANGNIYVGNAGPGIAAINGTALNGSGIYDPNSPEGLTYDSRDSLVYAANYGTNTITSFNASTGALVSANAPLSETFLRATFDPLNGDVYVATPDPGFLCLTPGMLTVINASSHPRVVAQIPVGYGPEASVLDPLSGLLFVANYCSNNVTIVNGSTQRTVGSGVPVGTAPIALGFDSLLNEIIVANGGSQNVTILNGSSGAIVAANISVGPQPDAVAVDAQTGWIYVADYGSGNLTVINGSTNARARADISVGACPEGVVYDALRNLMVSVNSCSSNLTVVNATTGAYINHSVPAGVGPVAAALDVGRDLLFVADAAGGTVAVVNLTTFGMEFAPVRVNSDPQGIVFVPTTDQVEVSDFLSGTISILATVPVILSFAAYPRIVEAGQPTQLAVVAMENGGVTLAIVYASLPPGCPSSNVSNLTCRTAALGTYRVEVTATDTRGYSGWNTLTLGVVSRLNADSLLISPGQVDIGGSVQLATMPTGGLGNDSYEYSGLPSGCASSDSSAISCTSTALGWFTVLVTATDTSGVSSSAAAGFLVVPRPVISGFGANPWNISTGEATRLKVAVTGGTAPYSFAYHGLPTGCVTSNSSEVECVPATPGSFDIQVTVTDAFNASVSASTSLNVVSILPLALSLPAFYATPTTVQLGETAWLIAVTSGGTGNDSFSYLGLPNGCTSSNVSKLSCRPATSGVYNITVHVVDSSGGSAAASTTLTSVSGASAMGTNPSAPWFEASWVVGGIGAISGATAGVGAQLLVARYRKGKSADR